LNNALVLAGSYLSIFPNSQYMRKMRGIESSEQ